MDMSVSGIQKTNTVRRLPDNWQPGKTGKGRQAQLRSPGFDSPRPTKFNGLKKRL